MQRQLPGADAKNSVGMFLAISLYDIPTRRTREEYKMMNAKHDEMRREAIADIIVSELNGWLN